MPLDFSTSSDNLILSALVDGPKEPVHIDEMQKLWVEDLKRLAPPVANPAHTKGAPPCALQLRRRCHVP